jgi:putative molybdopterin biosynthesis protein
MQILNSAVRSQAMLDSEDYMTCARLRSLILKRMDELERWYGDYETDPERIWARERDVILEVADGMARAGFPRLYAVGRDLYIDAESKAVKTYLARCLRALRSKRRAGATLADSERGKTDAPLKVADVARKLRISGRVAYELLQRGQIPSFRVGRSIRVKPEDLDTYIASQNGAGRPDPLACHRRPRKPRRL